MNTKTLNTIWLILFLLSSLFINLAQAKKLKVSKNEKTHDDEGMSTSDKLKLAGDCIRGLMASIPQSFCWKKGGDAGIIPNQCPPGYFRSMALCYVNCDPGYDFFGGVCWQRCDPGYANHGATCYKNLIRFYFKKSYIPKSITNFSDQIACTPGYYKPAGAALCYRDCKNIEMENCGIGACASDTATCATTIVDMGIGAIQGAIDVVAFVASFGSISIAQPAKTMVNNTVKKIGKSAMKNIVKSSVKSLKRFKSQIFSRAIKKVKENLVKSGKKVFDTAKNAIQTVKDKFGTTFKENVLLPSKDTVKSNVLGTICGAVFDQFLTKAEEEEKKDYPAEFDTVASVLDVVNIKGSVEACSDLSDGGDNCAKNVVTGLSTFDPTGILGLASTFMQPICEVPGEVPPIDPDIQRLTLLEETLKNKKCILVFDQCDFKGNSKEICDDQADLKEFDKKISSIVVGYDSYLTAFSDKDFNGISFSVSQGDVLRCLSDPVNFIAGKSFDKRISSLIIRKQRCIIFSTGKQTIPGVRPQQITNNFVCDTTTNDKNPIKKFSIPADHNWLYLYTFRLTLPILEFYKNKGYGDPSFVVTSFNFQNVRLADLDRNPVSFGFFQSLSQTQTYLTNNGKLLGRAMDKSIIPVDLNDPEENAVIKNSQKWMNKIVSFRSFNFPNNYMRHRNAEVWSEPGSGDLYNKDASFYVRQGLNYREGYVSFESVNYPGFYMRHFDFKINMSKNNNNDISNDASFLIRNSNVGDAQAYSIESANYPNYFIRHAYSRCSIAKKEDNDLFNKDSSWVIVNGLAK